MASMAFPAYSTGSLDPRVAANINPTYAPGSPQALMMGANGPIQNPWTGEMGYQNPGQNVSASQSGAPPQPMYGVQPGGSSFAGGQSPFAMGSQPNAQGPAGAFNVPNNLFGQQGFMPSGFSGYNANNANLNQPSPGMGFSQMHNNIMSPGGNFAQVQNPFMSMMGQGYGNSPYPQQGNGLNPNTIDPSMISSQVAAGYGPGAAVSTQPAWNAMVQSQNYNLQQGSDQLAEQFNNGGGLFSNAYGGAQGQYWEQAKLGQNAQLTQGQLQAMLAAQGIQGNAASQVSSQGLQSNEAMLNYQNQLNNQGMQSASGMGNLYDANLMAGLQLSGQQLGAYQNQATAGYQNWYSAQPYNNPFLQMASGAANQYPNQQFSPGWLTSLLGGIGSAAGGIGNLY